MFPYNQDRGISRNECLSIAHWDPPSLPPNLSVGSALAVVAQVRLQASFVKAIVTSCPAATVKYPQLLILHVKCALIKS